MIEHGIVFVIVAAASVYAGWKLVPRALREALAGALVRVAQRRGALSSRHASQLERRLAGTGCGACDSCGGCAGKPPTAGAPDAANIRFERR